MERGERRVTRASALLDTDDVMRERAISLKHSRSGHLSALTTVRKEIEALLTNSANVTLARDKLNRFQTLWNAFVDSHYKFIEVASEEDRARASEQFDSLSQQGLHLSASVEEFICNAAAELNERVMQDLRKISPELRSTKRTRSRGSSRSKGSSGSRALARRAEAEKARLALEFAEREKQRKITAEMKMLELERKHRETARIRAIEEEELKSIMRFEALKAEEDGKLAEARKTAALMDLEARLAEELEEELSDVDTASVPDPTDGLPRDPEVSRAPGRNLPPPSRTDTDPPSSNHGTTPTTYVHTATSVNPTIPEAGLPTSTLTSYSVTPRFSSREASSPIHYPANSVSLTPTADGQAPPAMSVSSPQQSTYFTPPVNSRLLEQSPLTSPSHDHTLALVATAMRDVSKAQQRLAYNQDLPPIQIKKFFGAPDEFPLFKQRFQHAVMSREDIDDENKMTRLLQFLGGEAKDAVCGLETAAGGIYQAIRILEERYGRPCMIVSSVVNNLTKGPPIAGGDKAALRKFADQATRALATLKSMGCLSEINQGNIISMTERLPKHLQNKFATLAFDLEAKGQSFTTLSDFASFVNRQASIANHPINQKANTTTPTKNRRVTPPPEKYDLPRITTMTTIGDRKPPPKNGKCRCCGQAHPLYRCETFKGKTPQERASFITANKLCPNCLKDTKHSADTCPSSFRCRVTGCGAFHHSLLHPTQFHVSVSEDHVSDARSTEVENLTAATSCTTTGTEDCDTDTVLLQVVPLRVVGHNGLAVTTYAMLDSGSEITLVDPSLVKLLHLRGQPDRLVFSTVSQRNEPQEGERVDLAVESLIDEQPRRLQLQGTWSGNELQIPLRHQCITANKGRWPHLQDVPFPEVDRPKISLIIGTNVSEAFIPLEVRHGNPEDPIAIRSCLGFAVLGRTGDRLKRESYDVHHIHAAVNDVSLNHQVELFWKSESFGTEHYKSMSMEDKHAEKIISNTISKLDGHYCVGLLWRQAEPKLPYNRQMAQIRLRHLKRRLERDEQLHVKYRSVINEYLTMGHARKLTQEEVGRLSDKTWYLPHHPVLNPNKPGKLRVVFDAAAKFNGTSLNDLLLQGPDYINNLAGVLMRFRQEQVTLIADIEKMFHQVRVPPEDCDALRFLWWPDNLNRDPEEYQMQVHIFGATCSPCCSNKALRQTADDNEARYGKQAAETVRRNFYVDDLLKSTSSVEEATTLANNLTGMLKEGGFRLTKFLSNRREVLLTLPSQERANPTLNLELDRLPINRTLGLHWDAERDVFCFKTVPTNKPATKRGVLSTISTLFDPLGLLSPFVLPVKVLIQELWKEKVEWDEKIEGRHLQIWKQWTSSLPLIELIQVPRCYRNPDMANNCAVELHLFSDASEYAYSAVAYLRLCDDSGQVQCSFVFGKSRNAPLKRPTIPRLELMASLMAVRVSSLVRAELELTIDRVTFWTDSLTVLQYIRNETRRFHRFVATRLEEIHEHTTPDQWHHVPGVLNPADDGSRGLPIDSFQPGCRWWSGPDFLWQSEDQWPHREVGTVKEDDAEVIRPRVNQNTLTVANSSSLNQLLERFSSWPKLVRTVSWLKRFVHYIQFKRILHSMPNKISLPEIHAASKIIIKIVQRQYFLEELQALKAGRPVRSSSKLTPLCPILVDGIICVGGRLRHAPVAPQAIHPPLIPREHPIATLLIRHHHEILGHAGREHVLSVLRQKIWIVNARALTRQILRGCVPCRKRHERVMNQMMGDLPEARLVPHEPPFTFTGLDFFGPFHAKRGRATEKVYGCIFVCLTSRAIHLEDVGSLETDAFIQALRRFTCIRGAAKEIWSDNGTNFTGAERELTLAIEQLDHEMIQRSLHEKEVEWYCQPLKKWHFQPPTASHMSGVWERLIRSVRNTMKAVLGHPHALVTRETLRTVFAEAVGILNSRPLCPSSDDPKDSDPITPSHLLQQRQGMSLPPGEFHKADIHSRKQWRRGQLLASHFWNRWIREYLPLLQERKKWILKRRNLAVNDLVLVVTEKLPRGHWLLGRVVKVFPGPDGLVRTAEVKTKNSTFLRPISKLCLLEESK